MIILIKTLQVILALAILIIIHELGHFTFAKIFKIKVDKFFLFFDAWGVKLFSTKTTKWFVKLFPKFKDYETEYGIGWLPLGGYCKINGMVDESLDMQSLKKEPKPWEFRTKPAWQRLLVMAGGVLYNFIFAIAVYIVMFSIWGDTYLSNSGNKIYVNNLAYEMGFRNGDRILKFDDYEPKDFDMLQADLARRSVKKAEVLRGKDTVDIYIDRRMIGQVLNTPNMFGLAVPFVIDSLVENSPNTELRSGDMITQIDTEKIAYVQDSRAVFKSNKGKRVNAKIVRNGDTLDMALQVDTSGRIGVYTQIPGLKKQDYSIIQAIPAGLKYTLSSIGGYVRDLKLVATPSTEAYKSLGSFIAIGQVFPAKWNWLLFINLLAILSIMLGVMNLIPIPGLDGGHILFTIYEMVSGKKPSESFLAAAQIIGMLLLLALMVLAFGNDIGRLIK
ncbi:MAG: RIP metalloprotease RseP [Bacteroidales bacterium]|jgi:regulator of sigma E protease|nr:RIP metalloprotease RseP [Bacteroidales bacterium]